jgi:hypothetical protein
MPYLQHLQAMAATYPPVDMAAFETSLGGKRIFTRQLMEEVAELATQAQNPTNTADLYIKDIHGVPRRFWSPS